MIGTLESSVRVALEIRCTKVIQSINFLFLLHKKLISNELTTHGWILVGIVTAIISAIADVGERDAEIVVTFKSGLWTIFSSGISRRATEFVAHIAAISRSVATKIWCDAMTAFTLEALALRDEKYK